MLCTILGHVGCIAWDLLKVKVLGSDEGNKLVLSDYNVLDTILGDIYEITLRHDVGTNMESSNGYIDGYNDGNLDELLLVE